MSVYISWKKHVTIKKLPWTVSQSEMNYRRYPLPSKYFWNVTPLALRFIWFGPLTFVIWTPNWCSSHSRYSLDATKRVSPHCFLSNSDLGSVGGESFEEHFSLWICFTQVASMLTLKMVWLSFSWSKRSLGFRLFFWSSRSFSRPWAMKTRLHWTFAQWLGELWWTWSLGNPGGQVPRFFPLAFSCKGEILNWVNSFFFPHNFHRNKLFLIALHYKCVNLFLWWLR